MNLGGEKTWVFLQVKKIIVVCTTQNCVRHGFEMKSTTFFGGWVRFFVTMKIHIRFHDTIIFSPVKIHLFYGDETSLLYIEGCFGHEFSSPLWRRICGVEKKLWRIFSVVEKNLWAGSFFIFCVVKFHLRKIHHRHWFEMKSNALHFWKIISETFFGAHPIFKASIQKAKTKLSFH